MSGGRAETRLAELAVRHGLPERVVVALRRLLEVLAADEHAATTVKRPDDAVDRHVADALSALDLEEVVAARSIVDLGSGAGVPALPLAAALPDCAVTALDAVGRKVEWTVATARAMGLANVDGVHARAEEWGRERRAVDVVVARAVAPSAVLLEYARPLLRDGGVLVAWKGETDDEEAAGAVVAAERLAFAAVRTVATTPWPGARRRRLDVWRAQGPVPPGFPRRVGVARKRPLGPVGAVRETPAGPVRPPRD